MTKKVFRNTILFFSFVLGGIFLNSCSNLLSEKSEENNAVKISTVSFGISDSDSYISARTAIPNSDEHDLKKYLYLYNYTLTYVNENGENDASEENIICNDVSFDKFKDESTIRLATGKKYKFTLKAKDGAITRMEGSSIITLSEKPSQKVTIVLMPAGDEYGQKLRVDWIVPDDGVIATMKAGISPKRGQAEFQSENEILVPKYRFQEYVFSVVPNPFMDSDPRKSEYGKTIKRIGVTYDDVKTGVPRWLDYKFYDSNGVLVYESSESIYMIGGKTSSTVIYISPDHYYRRPVNIPVYKDGTLWINNSELEVKLVDKNGNEYIFKPVFDEQGNLTGEFEGLLPGKSSGDGLAEATDGIFDIYVGLDGNDTSEKEVFVKIGAKYDANSGIINGNGGVGIGSGKTDTVELVTVPVPHKGVSLTPANGVLAVCGTVGDGSGNGGLIVPAGQDFSVKVDLDLGYKTLDDGKITICGKTVRNGEIVTLNTKADDLSSGIIVSGIEAIEYSIVYKTKENLINFQNEPTTVFSIESSDIELPKEDDFEDSFKDGLNKIGGWWFGTGTAEDNKDNIIHKINAEKAVKEKLINSANLNNEVVLNVYWIPVTDVEYKLVYKFEDLGSNPATYSEDRNIVSFHNVSIPKEQDTEVEIPQVPGFTTFEIKTGENVESPAEGFTTITLDGKPEVDKEVITKEIHYKRNTVELKFWFDEETLIKSCIGKYGETHEHVDNPEREDYKFLGWHVKGDTSKTLVKHVDELKFPPESVEYIAKWEQTQAAYKVEFYYETVDSTSAKPKYEMTSSYSVKGAVDTFPAFNTTPQTGFTYNDQKRSITAGEGGPSVNVVKAEGNTLVKLYFDRKIVTVTLKSNGGKFINNKGNTTEEIILEGKYGTALPSTDSKGFRVQVPQSPVLEGIDDGSIEGDDFTFNAWHVHTESDLVAALPSTFPEENAIYAARWNQINGVYKVVHWAESMDKYENGEYKLLAPKAIDGFTGQMLEGSVTKKGKIGSAMVYYHTLVTGFKAPTVEIRNSSGIITEAAGAGNITLDAKTEVIVTYLRKDYTIRFHMNAGGDTNAKWYGIDAGSGSSETVTRTGKYRIDFTPPENPVREHFIFRGWTKDAPGSLENRVDVVPSFTEGAPTDYYAVWYSKASGGLEIDTSDIALSYSLTSTQIVANVVIPEGEGTWTYTWSVNNVPLSEIAGATLSADNKILTLSDCLKKDYEITVVAKHNGKVYTKTKIVTVK